MLHQFNRTRLAPTPSGFLHIGNVLSFSLTAALAQKCGAKILLRIDDLDQARANSQYVQDIFDTLTFLEIPWDEGPRNARELTEHHSQVHRMDVYREALDQLIKAGAIFACACSRKELLAAGPCPCRDKNIPLNAENVSWRMATKNLPQLTVTNYDSSKIQSFLPEEMRDLVVRKKDGFPAYQLTSVVDDLLYGVDLIVRGQDLWPSTLAQSALATAMGNDTFNEIAFFHHRLLTEPSGRKMSKSAGAASVRFLREGGKTKAQIFAMIGDLLELNGGIESWQELAENLMPVT